MTKIKKIKEFFEANSISGANLTDKLNLFADWYSKNKYYFFNGEEHLFESMDTDTFFKMCFYNNIKLLAFSHKENRILLETERELNFLPIIAFGPLIQFLQEMNIQYPNYTCLVILLFLMLG